MTDQYDRERAAFESGTCSRCGGTAERGRMSGAWWHMPGLSCVGDFEWWVPAHFIPDGVGLEPCESCGAKRNEPCREGCSEDVDCRSVP